MITVIVRRVIPLVGIGVFMGLIVQRVQLPQAAGDIWFHLRIGHEFRDGWSISDPGHLGGFDNAQWVPTQWASQIGLAQLESWTGLSGVLWVTGLVHITIVMCIYLTAHEVDAHDDRDVH